MIRVKATARGYYGNMRRDPGDEFEIASGDAFSVQWMERVDGGGEPVTRGKPGRKPKQVDPVNPEPEAEIIARAEQLSGRGGLTLDEAKAILSEATE